MYVSELVWYMIIKGKGVVGDGVVQLVWLMRSKCNVRDICEVERG